MWSSEGEDTENSRQQRIPLKLDLHEFGSQSGLDCMLQVDSLGDLLDHVASLLDMRSHTVIEILPPQ